MIWSFNPVLLPLCGPFAVQIYGLFIAVALIVFVIATFNHPLRKHFLSASLYERLVVTTVIAGIIGARLVHLISEWHSYEHFSDFFWVWNGGLSILGAIMAGLVVVPLFLWWHRVPILPLFDLIALYLPLAQAIARLGCLCGGCCFGCATHVSWSITYTHPASHAPLDVALHPTQLYSSLIFLFLWVIIQLVWCSAKIKPGQLMAIYLIGAGLERFMVDFWRGDRIISSTESLIYSSFLSMHQWISLGIIALGILLSLLFKHSLSKGKLQ